MVFRRKSWIIPNRERCMWMSFLCKHIGMWRLHFSLLLWSLSVPRCSVCWCLPCDAICFPIAIGLANRGNLKLREPTRHVLVDFHRAWPLTPGGPLYPPGLPQQHSRGIENTEPSLSQQSPIELVFVNSNWRVIKVELFRSFEHVTRCNHSVWLVFSAAKQIIDANVFLFKWIILG